eukprot:gene38824-52442_t
MMMISILFALTLFSFSSYTCSCYKFLSVANSFFHRRNYIFYHSTKSSLHLSTIFEEEAKAIIEPAAKSFLDAIQYSLLNVPTYISPAPLSTSYLKIQSEGKNGNKRLPLVLLHGFDSSLLEFRRFARLVAKATRRDVFIPDILGWGFINCSAVADVSPKAKLEHLKCFIEQIV